MKTTDPETQTLTDRELLQKVQEVINGKVPPILLGTEGGHIHMPASLIPCSHSSHPRPSFRPIGASPQCPQNDSPPLYERSRP